MRGAVTPRPIRLHVVVRGQAQEQLYISDIKSLPSSVNCPIGQVGSSREGKLGPFPPHYSQKLLLNGHRKIALQDDKEQYNVNMGRHNLVTTDWRRVIFPSTLYAVMVWFMVYTGRYGMLSAEHTTRSTMGKNSWALFGSQRHFRTRRINHIPVIPRVGTK
jgi:hypothetical protein